MVNPIFKSFTKFKNYLKSYKNKNKSYKKRHSSLNYKLEPSVKQKISMMDALVDKAYVNTWRRIEKELGGIVPDIEDSDLVDVVNIRNINDPKLLYYGKRSKRNRNRRSKKIKKRYSN